MAVGDYSDWELHSSNQADIDLARQQLGFTSGDAFLNGVLYSIMIYGTKYVQQGTKQVNIPPRITIVPLPDDSPYVFAAG
jgi:hypothetical protein